MIRLKQDEPVPACALAVRGALAMLACRSPPPRTATTTHGDSSATRTSGTIASFNATTGRLTICPSTAIRSAAWSPTGPEIKCEDAARTGDDGDTGARPRRGRVVATTMADMARRAWRRPRRTTAKRPVTTMAATTPAPRLVALRPRTPSGHDDNGDDGANCTTADLIAGATVEEADLELEHGSATFDEVELEPAELLGVEPVRADADVDLERRVELVGGAHLAPHQLGRAVHLLRRALEEQLVVDLQDEAGLVPRSPRSARWQRTIATLMMSAAVPWITVLTASRSPRRRVLGLPERSSGIGRRRPISVVT